MTFSWTNLGGWLRVGGRTDALGNVQTTTTCN